MGTSLLLNFRTNQEVVMKQKKSIVVVVLTIFFSFILLSGTLSAQSFSGYKDFRFDMNRNDVIPILKRICKGLHWDANKKYYDIDSHFIVGNRCYRIFGLFRDIHFTFYSDSTGKLAIIGVGMDSYDRSKHSNFMKQYVRVNESLKGKYRLDIPINNNLYKRWFESEFEKIYEIYNDGKVVLSLQDYHFHGVVFKKLFVIYNNNHLARNAVDYAKKSLGAKSDDF